jgi:hypothetical protein
LQMLSEFDAGSKIKMFAVKLLRPMRLAKASIFVA